VSVSREIVSLIVSVLSQSKNASAILGRYSVHFREQSDRINI